MPDQEQMTIDERWKYLRIMSERYKEATRQEQTDLLNEMEVMTGLHRKSLIRRLNSTLTRKPRQRQRGRIYGAAVDDALRVIAESFDYPCAERLAGNLDWMARQLAHHGELSPSSELLDQLDRLSVSTIRRILQRIGQDIPRLPHKRSRQPRRLTQDIPMKRIPWDEAEPGHFEVDLVHHCGPSTTGEYVHTLQMIDVATGWSERVAVLGRSQRVIVDGFRRILDRLHIPVLEIHPDNGSEFFNAHLIRFWREVVKGVHLSRSRPYQKNDNRFVEQKNESLVRAYLGHDRLDTVQQTLMINDLYDKLWLYDNFLRPVMRLTEKTLVHSDDGTARVRRRYDQALTPYDRLCATQVLSEDDQAELSRRRKACNPRSLREEIYAMIDHLFSLPNAVPGQTEDIFKTLYAPQDA